MKSAEPKGECKTEIRWTRTWDDDLMAEDYSAWCEDRNVGRIHRLERTTSAPARWFWVARIGIPQPTGIEASRREAMLAVEEQCNDEA